MGWRCITDQRGQSSWWCNLPTRRAAEAERSLRIQYWPEKYDDTLYRAVLQTETGYGDVRETSEHASLEAAQAWCED